MSNNDNETTDDEAGTGTVLGDFTTEPERIAVQTLIEESTSPDLPSEDTIDSIFSVLSNPGRRYVLTYLLRADGYVTMTELVDYAVEQTDAANAGEEFRHRVTVELSQTHLPELVDAGFVRYNMERQLIDETEKTQLVSPYLKLALAQQDILDAED